MPNDFLSVAEAADQLGVSKETLRRWVEERRVRHIRFPSGAIRFRPSDIAELLEPIEPGEAAS